MSSESPSVLQTTLSLLNQLNQSIPLIPSQQHPLSQLSPHQLSQTRQQLSQTFSNLRNACNTFQKTVLDPAPLSTAPGGAASTAAKEKAQRGNLEKYLTLLKERAGSESIIGTHQDEVNQAKKFLKRREEYEEAIPVLSQELLLPFTSTSTSSTPTTTLDRTILILEQIGHSLLLSSFKEPSPLPTDQHSFTLSYIGKLMVVDLELSPIGAVTIVRFSYALGGVTKDDEVLGEGLKALLKGVENVGEGEGAELEKRLKEFRKTLRELKELDEWTEGLASTTNSKEGSGGDCDCFVAAKKFKTALREVLSEESNESKTLATLPSSHGLLLPSLPPSSTLVYSLSSIQTDLLSSSPSIPSPSFSEGIRSLTIKLSPPSETSSSFKIPESYLSPSTKAFRTFEEKERKDLPEFEIRFKNGEEVVIGRSTGRRILNVLRGGNGEENVNMEEDSDVGEGGGGGKEEKAWLEDLLTNGTYTPTKRYAPPLSSEEEKPYHFTVSPTSRKAHPGFICSRVRVRDPNQLWRIIEILQEQETYNEILRSVLDEEYAISEDAMGEGGKGKRRKVRKGGVGMTLDDLFSSPPLYTPVSLSLLPSSSSLTLTFPSNQSTPISITITILPTSAPKVEFEGVAINEETRRKAGEVMRRTRDLGVFMSWVGKVFGLGKGVEEKEDVVME